MKKVLSFVLILALVLGSFSFAFGLSDVTAGDANSEAITVCNDLGIVEGFPDGTFKPEQNVTRAEFAAMITRALAVPESALAAYTTTSFKDTNGYGWAVKYLAFCASKGIMIGDGYGNVMPGRNINVNEAITMAVRTIGYTENSSMLVGTWPGNYVTLGQTLGLYDDVANATIITRENAAQVIYNSLTVGMVAVNADGATTSVMDNTVSPPAVKTLLTAGLGAKVQPAAVIDNVTFDSLINLMPYVGAYGVVYTNGDKEVIAVGSVSSTFLTVDEYDTTKDYFKTADGTKYYFDTANFDTNSATAKLFVNGYASGGALIITTANVTEGATYAVALTGKTVTKAYSKIEWTPTTGFLFAKDMLDENDEINGYKFPMNDTDAIDYGKVELRGVSSLKDINVDDVVLVYQSGSKNTRVTVGKETVKGLVTKSNADEDVFTINSKEYSVSASSAGNTTDLAVGNTGTAHLDYAGDVFKFALDDASVGNYAIVIGARTSTLYTTQTCYLKLFTKDGVEVEYVLAQNVLDNLPSGIVTAAAASYTDGKIVEFALNKDSKINSLKALATGPATSLQSGYIAADGTMIGTTPVRSEAVIFAYDGSDYTIHTYKNLAGENTVSSGALLMAYLDAGRIKVMFVPAADKSNVLGGTDTTFGVITGVSNVYNADQDANYVYLNAFENGVALNAFSNELWSAKTIVKSTTNASALLKFTRDADGLVKVATEGAFVTGDPTKSGPYTVSGFEAEGNMVYTGNKAAYYAIAPNAALYVWDSATSMFTMKAGTSLSSLKTKTVYLYESDDKSPGYDIAIAW